MANAQPKTMEELLASADKQLKVPLKGSIVEGVITDITKKMVVVDIGGKTEGVVVDKEFELAADFIEDLAVGDTISVYIISSENDKGQTLLSLKKAAMDKKWDMFINALENNLNVNVKGVELNKGGMIVVSYGIRGFVPSSQFGKVHLGKLHELIGKKFDVKVIEVDREKNRLIFSERHVSEQNIIEQRDAALTSIKVGDALDGTVSGIMPFGLFITVEVNTQDSKKGQVEGLVHISEMSWMKVEDPNKLFKVGDKVKVKVLGIDQAAGKLNLSIKQLTDDPWNTIAERYPVGSTITGKVSRIESFGVFVNFEPGVDGLIHISKVTSLDEYQIGDKVTVNVESIESDKRRMSLSPVLTTVPMGYK
jgi:ribosomal protein S1